MALKVTDATYTWQFLNFTCYPTASGHTDVAVNTFYSLTATIGSYNATTRGVQEFPLPASGSVFIPFEDLTIPIVQEWVETAMGPVYLYKIKQGLVNQLDEQINFPVEYKPAPWTSPPTSSI
jgi:hypothetical protein